MEQLIENWPAILIAVIGLLGVGIVARIVVNRNRNKQKVDASSSIVSQSGNIAGGDIVGRDKKQ